MIHGHLGDFVCTNAQSFVLLFCEIHPKITKVRSIKIFHINVFYGYLTNIPEYVSNKYKCNLLVVNII